MTDREKLIGLLDKVHHRPLGKEYRERLTTISDHLIANGVTFTTDNNVGITPVVPGHDDQYNIAEMSYNNGYAKGLEDGKPKWIPVEERLPEDDLPKDSMAKQIKVIVAYKRGNCSWVIRTQRRQKGRLYGRPDEWDWSVSDPISHWMPLP